MRINSLCTSKFNTICKRKVLNQPDLREWRRTDEDDCICWWFAYHLAYLKVNSLAFASAPFLLVFHSSAAWLLRGSSGFGSAKRHWIDKSTDFICNAGDQFFLRISRHMRPRLSAFVGIYQCLDGRFWYRRPPLAETWGSHLAGEALPWTFLPHSTFPEGLLYARVYLAVRWRSAYN